MQRNSLTIILVFMLAWCASNLASAEGLSKDISVKVSDPKQSKKYQCRLISRGEAINQAKRKVKGKVVGVQLSERGNRSVYKVRMLVEQKRVKTVPINACR